MVYVATIYLVSIKNASLQNLLCSSKAIVYFSVVRQCLSKSQPNKHANNGEIYAPKQSKENIINFSIKY